MQRPASVTVFGILNIVFALFGLFGIIATFGMLAMTDASTNPIVRLMHENAAYAAWLKLTIPLGALTCVALVAAGIGLLMLKPWARKLSIAYAIYAIVITLIGVVINFVFLFRPLLEEAQRSRGSETAGAIGGAIGGTVGGCFGMIYPLLLLIFMLRPKVAAAFRPPDSEMPLVS